MNHVQKKLTPEELATGEQVSPAIYDFVNKLEAILKTFAEEHPNFRYAVTFGDETTQAMGCMGNMSDRLAAYAVGLYKRAKEAKDHGVDGGP